MIAALSRVIGEKDVLKGIGVALDQLGASITDQPPEAGMDAIKLVEKKLGAMDGAGSIESMLSKARRKLRGDTPKRDEALALLDQARALYKTELAWRTRAAQTLARDIEAYDLAIRGSIGLRMQTRLSIEQAQEVASCQAHHRDISLNF